MAYESTPRVKTRSASISAPTSGSLETILNPSNGTPDMGYQRRRVATRTQSARITGARSVSYNHIAYTWCGFLCSFNCRLLHFFFITIRDFLLRFNGVDLHRRVEEK